MADQPDPRRVRAWTALAALFIDNEVGPADYQAAAGSLMADLFTPEECEHMLRAEVAPVFAVNLWSPAGE